MDQRAGLRVTRELREPGAGRRGEGCRGRRSGSGSRHRGRGGPGLPVRPLRVRARALPQRGRGRESGSEREGSGGPAAPPVRCLTRAPARPRGRHKGSVSPARRCRGSAAAASAEGRGGERGATFRTCLVLTGGAALARVPKAPFLGDPAAGHVGEDGAGAGGSAAAAPCPPGTRLGGTRACTGADISHQARATGCPRASLPPCHKNKPLISSARCVPSREVAAVRTGTICPAIPGDADIFL